MILDFRNYWQTFRKIAMKNQLTLQAPSDFNWPGANL
jgi:hypothetical protein